jgi:hypothetical protein
MDQEIVVSTDEQGNPHITVRGVKGKSCKDLTVELEKALGVVTKDDLTHEYHARTQHTQIQK